MTTAVAAPLPLPPPKVSVAMATYNHERFIAQAIESVLFQKTTFPYELVIGEDCSTDQTRAIISDFQRRYPHLIRLLFTDRNTGGMENFIQTLRACRGRYIALLDGDDCWTSPFKLQSQVELLDQTPSLAMCYHDVLTFQDDGLGRSRAISVRKRRIATLEDLLWSPPASCSVMFRRGLFGDFPAWFHTLQIGDWPLHVLNAQKGPVGYIEEVMAARRKHAGGAYTALANVAKLEAKVKVYQCLDLHLGGSYRGLVRSLMARCYYRLALECENSGETTRARAYARKCVAARPFNRYVSAKGLAMTFARLYSPVAYQLARHALRLVKRTPPTDDESDEIQIVNEMDF